MLVDWHAYLIVRPDSQRSSSKLIHASACVCRIIKIWEPKVREGKKSKYLSLWQKLLGRGPRGVCRLVYFSWWHGSRTPEKIVLHNAGERTLGTRLVIHEVYFAPGRKERGSLFTPCCAPASTIIIFKLPGECDSCKPDFCITFSFSWTARVKYENLQKADFCSYYFSSDTR